MFGHEHFGGNSSFVSNVLRNNDLNSASMLPRTSHWMDAKGVAELSENRQRSSCNVSNNCRFEEMGDEAVHELPGAWKTGSRMQYASTKVQNAIVRRSA